jgi:branched-chain amino acid aminotransferase
MTQPAYSDPVFDSLVYYVNGEYVPAQRASLPLNDLGLVRGYGVFDVLRTYDHRPFKLREHVQRLQKSAASIGIDAPWSTQELEQLVHETLRRNYDANPDLGDVNVRLVLTGGPSDNCFTPQRTPSLAIMISPVPPRDEALYARGAKLITVDLERFMPTVKSLNYISAIMGAARAQEAGAVEALYRTGDGFVTEGTRTSFFVVQDGRLITSSQAILDGITRRVVMEIAADRFEVVVEPISYAQLGAVDEAILVGTTKEVLPIVQIDDIQIGDGRPGPVTRELAQIFRAYVNAETTNAESGTV